MKMTVDLPEDLVRQLKLRAVHEGRKLKDLVDELLREALHHAGAVSRKKRETKAARRGKVIVDEDGFPSFRCRPDAPAKRMTVEELLKLEQECLQEEELRRAGLPD